MGIIRQGSVHFGDLIFDGRITSYIFNSLAFSGQVFPANDGREMLFFCLQTVAGAGASGGAWIGPSAGVGYEVKFPPPGPAFVISANYLFTRREYGNFIDQSIYVLFPPMLGGPRLFISEQMCKCK